MAVQKLLDFADIINAVMEELKIQSTDTASKNKIKRMINEVYIDEVVPFERWRWAIGNFSVRHKAYYGVGTVTVTPESTTVTLSVPPASSTGSRKGYKFAVDSFDEIYTISAHTAGSATVTLDCEYNGAFSTTAVYKIWSDSIDLPTDCEQVITVWHDYHKPEVDGKGPQDFRRLVAGSPRHEGRPVYFSQTDFYDPTSTTPETESDRYRQLRLYPSINAEHTQLHVDYQKEVAALDLDGDEPIIPIQHRVVLKYGALARAWPSLMRNPEEGARNQQMFEAKLARMAGQVEKGNDKPQLTPDSDYLSQKRGPRLKTQDRYHGANGGGSSYTAPTYLINATIAGANITENVTVVALKTIDGRDISVDGAAMDSHIASTTAHGATGAVVGTTNTQTLTNKTISGASNTITNVVASNVVNIPSGNLAATTIQAAVNELQTDIDTRATSAALTTHTGASTGVHGVVGAVIGTTDTQTLTNKTIDADLNTVTNIENADIKAAAAIALNKLAATTVSRALVSDASGFVSPATTTATEIGYVNGVTSAIQTQLGLKAPSASPTLTTPTMDVINLDDQASSPSTPSAGYIKLYGKTDNKIYKKTSDGTETELGAGGAGGINYLTIGDAETNSATAFSTYDDGAGATRPVDGTGGVSSTVTITATATNALRGTYSFNLAKSAADGRGEGISTPFTIHRQDRNKILVVETEAELQSGTYSDGTSTTDSDLIVYLYDVTNSTLIEPVNMKITTGVIGTNTKTVSTFQTSSSLSYRLIYHVATVSASAWSINFEAKVGPQNISYGVPVTDWTSYTPTWGATTTAPTLGTIGFQKAMWRRVGDTMEIIYQLYTTTAGTAGSGTYLFPLPTGYTIDSTKHTADNGGGTSTLGSMRVYTTDATKTGTGSARAHTSTQLSFVAGTDTSAPANIDNTFFAFSSSSVQISFEVKVPITGWSSNLALSSSGDEGRVVSGKVVGAGGAAQTVTTTATQITYATVSKDTHGAWNAGTNTLTIPVTGDYRFTLVAEPFVASGANSFYLEFNVNGAVVERATEQASAGFDRVGTYSFERYLTAGQTVNFKVSMSAGTMSLDRAASASTFAWSRIAGPQTISASESVSAKYNSAAGQSIPNNTWTTLTHATKVWDSHSSVSSGSFTCPVSGEWAVSALVIWAANAGWAVDEEAAVRVTVDGVSQGYLDHFECEVTRTQVVTLTGSNTVKALAGQVIAIQALQVSGGAIALVTSTDYNWISFRRVGNY